MTYFFCSEYNREKRREQYLNVFRKKKQDFDFYIHILHGTMSAKSEEMELERERREKLCFSLK